MKLLRCQRARGEEHLVCVASFTQENMLAFFGASSLGLAQKILR